MVFHVLLNFFSLFFFLIPKEFFFRGFSVMTPDFQIPVDHSIFRNQKLPKKCVYEVSTPANGNHFHSASAHGFINLQYKPLIDFGF